MYKEGLVRIATEEYDPSRKNNRRDWNYRISQLYNVRLEFDTRE